MVQAKVIRVVRDLLGGAVAAFCELQTPPVSLSTRGPEGVIHQLRQHSSCRSCAGVRHAVTARLSSGTPKAADARDSKHGRDSVASRAHSALHTQKVSAKLPAGASVCGLHDEVGTAADWEMARWAAFPQLDALFWLGDKHRVQACRCSRKLLDNASSWAPSTVATPSLRGQAFILVAVSSGPEVVAAAAT